MCMKHVEFLLQKIAKLEISKEAKFEFSKEANKENPKNFSLAVGAAATCRIQWQMSQRKIQVMQVGIWIWNLWVIQVWVMTKSGADYGNLGFMYWRMQKSCGVIGTQLWLVNVPRLPTEKLLGVFSRYGGVQVVRCVKSYSAWSFRFCGLKRHGVKILESVGKIYWILLS